MSHRLKRFISALVVGALAVAIAAGCIAESTAPTAQQTSARGTASSLDDGRTRTWFGSPLDPLVKLIVRGVSVSAGQPATITNVRWRLDVPAGAIAGDATVGIGVQSPSAFSCRLQILPETLNH